MAKRKKKSKGSSRRKGRKRVAKGSSKRKGRGGRGGRRVATPSMDVVYLAGAMVLGEVIAEELLTTASGPLLPQILDAKAVGLWIYAYWTKRADLQQVAYALQLVELAEDQGVVATVKIQAAALRGMLPGAGGASASEAEEAEEATAEATAQIDNEEVAAQLEEATEEEIEDVSDEEYDEEYPNLQHV